MGCPMDGSRLDNYRIYVHLDKADISVMGRPEHNSQISQYAPLLAHSIAVCLHEGQVRTGRLQNTEYGWMQKLYVEYATGRITLRYDKRFRNIPLDTEEAKFQKYIMMHVTIENYNKLDYSHHHYVCRIVDACLEQHWTTRDYHIRRAELAGDTLDLTVGAELFRTMVPYNACIEGWECKGKSPEHPNGLKRRAWVSGADGQYYWGSKTEVDKERDHRRREWNPHIHKYGEIPIWRIELRLGWKYLSERGIRNHDQLLGQVESLYRHNVRFKRPRLEDIRKFLNKCKQNGKHKRFTLKSWPAYLKWEAFSTCAWMDDLQKRIGTSVSRFFYNCKYPEIYTGERLNAYNDSEYGGIYVLDTTC